MKNFEEINRAQGAKKANNLKELRELRNQEKAIKARIDEISDEATQEAVATADGSHRYDELQTLQGRGRQAVAESRRAAGFCQEDRFGLLQGDGGDRQSVCRYAPRLGSR